MMIVNRSKERTGLIFFFFCALYLIIMLNLMAIQIVRKKHYLGLAEKQYLHTITTWQPRAPILDRTGNHYLALNKESISAFILPQKIEEPDQLKQFLKDYFPAAFNRLEKNGHKHFLYIKRRLSKEEQEHIEKSSLPDIKLLCEPSRYYPLEAASPLIGITDIDNQGLFGLELSFQKQLAGSPTIFELEKDARSGHFYFNKETKITGQKPESLQLTIDSTLQFLAYESLKQTLEKYNAKEGGVVIMDPHTGALSVLVSAPAFDPNNTSNLQLATTKNSCITECYELGSVIKICAALAALEEGVVTADELIDCQNSKTAYVNGRKVNTWKAHGIIPFSQVIAQSNNIGIATVATRLDTKLYDYYIQLGFGKKTDIPLPGEQKGYINHPKNWSKHSIISLSYGYEITSNLLQLARSFSIIANGGYWIQPLLVLDKKVHDQKERLFSQNAIDAIKSILEKTTREGTARRAAVKGYRVMSKTGTANLLDATGHYDPHKNIYTCAGIIEKGDYTRVIITFVKEAGTKNIYASTVAVPLFEEIAQKTLIHDKII